MTPTIEPEELWVLSYYRASELAGALLFGRLARRVLDPELGTYLTRHFAEEARHAWLWTETIQRLGHLPIPITETYQSRYAREIGIPTAMPDILALTQVFERRICRHFRRHAEREATHALVKETLQAMLQDEVGHLDWIARKLEEYQDSGVADSASLVQRYTEIDERIYRDALNYEGRLWDFLGMGPGGERVG